MTTTPELTTDPEPTAPRPASTSRLRRVIGWAVDTPEPLIFVVLLTLVVTFTIIAPSAFLSAANLRSMGTDAALLLLISIGMCFVIISGGIDLSIGSVLVFSSVVSMQVMLALGGDGWGTVLVGLLVGVLSGVLWGAINGFLVAYLKLESLIVTLGTMGAALGAARLLTGGVNLAGVPSELVSDVGQFRPFGIPSFVLIGLAAAVIFGMLLNRTRFGRHTFAIGSNSEAALRSGIVVRRHLVSVYILSGALAGLAGYLSLARFATTTIEGHATDILKAITAVVLGGASLAGGRGSVWGTVAGVLIPVVLTAGLVISGLQAFWQEVLIGAILIAAVIVDRERRRRRRSS